MTRKVTTAYLEEDTINLLKENGITNISEYIRRLIETDLAQARNLDIRLKVIQSQKAELNEQIDKINITEQEIIKEKEKQEEYQHKKEELRLLGINNENELKFLLNIIKLRKKEKEWINLYKDWKENHQEWVENHSGTQIEDFVKLLDKIGAMFSEEIGE